MVKCFIGVGSNLGDREASIKKAVSLLRKAKIKIIKKSSLTETRPIGGPKQGKFLNGAIEVETGLGPFKLLKSLKTIEKKLGRTRAAKNSPRIIDLDILFYGDEVIRTSRLTIPHPRMRQRSFVIRPLKEIAPEIVKSMSLKAK